MIKQQFFLMLILFTNLLCAMDRSVVDFNKLLPDFQKSVIGFSIGLSDETATQVENLRWVSKKCRENTRTFLTSWAQNSAAMDQDYALPRVLKSLNNKLTSIDACICSVGVHSIDMSKTHYVKKLMPFVKYYCQATKQTDNTAVRQLKLINYHAIHMDFMMEVAMLARDFGYTLAEEVVGEKLAVIDTNYSLSLDEYSIESTVKELDQFPDEETFIAYTGTPEYNMAYGMSHEYSNIGALLTTVQNNNPIITPLAFMYCVFLGNIWVDRYPRGDLFKNFYECGARLGVARPNLQILQRRFANQPLCLEIINKTYGECMAIKNQI
jgi:hypothetical protein